MTSSNKESPTLRVVTTEGLGKLQATVRQYHEQAELSETPYKARINRAVAQGLEAVAARAPKDVEERTIQEVITVGAGTRKLTETERRAAMNLIRAEAKDIRVEERIKLKRLRQGQGCRRLPLPKPA